MDCTLDFTKLKETEHMLRWIAGDDPYGALRASVEKTLKEQVSDSRLKQFVVLSNPDWLTGAIPSEEDKTKAVLVRCAVAFEIALSVESAGELHRLAGVFTWAAVNLNQPGKRKDRVWMDLSGTLATFGSEGELKNRVYFE
jgi:hypothetical protein